MKENKQQEKIENQVTSLGLSKQLMKVGYPQEGIWWWAKTYGEWDVVLRGELKSLKGCFVAPTVAELGYWLKPNDKTGTIATGITGDGSYCIGTGIQVYDYPHRYAGSEADLRARMLIWLIREGYLYFG